MVSQKVKKIVIATPDLIRGKQSHHFQPIEPIFPFVRFVAPLLAMTSRDLFGTFEIWAFEIVSSFEFRASDLDPLVLKGLQLCSHLYQGLLVFEEDGDQDRLKRPGP